MKTVLTALALVLTMGCHRTEIPDPPAGWAEKAAVDWATDLGESTPKTTCFTNSEYVDARFISDCSVYAFGHIHKLWCHYPEMKCSEVLPRQF